MRTSRAGAETYVADVAELMERIGIVLTRPGDSEDLEILEAIDGSLSFEVHGTLPGAAGSTPARVEIREELAPVGNDVVETSRYGFELVDVASDVRRAYHLHDPDWFVRRFRVVVHEHCEHPIGQADCEHHEGSPVRDAFHGVMLLLDAWMAGAAECDELRCLERSSGSSVAR